MKLPRFLLCPSDWAWPRGGPVDRVRRGPAAARRRVAPVLHGRPRHLLGCGGAAGALGLGRACPTRSCSGCCCPRATARAWRSWSRRARRRWARVRGHLGAPGRRAHVRGDHCAARGPGGADLPGAARRLPGPGLRLRPGRPGSRRRPRRASGCRTIPRAAGALGPGRSGRSIRPAPSLPCRRGAYGLEARRPRRPGSRSSTAGRGPGPGPAHAGLPGARRSGRGGAEGRNAR